MLQVISEKKKSKTFAFVCCGRNGIWFLMKTDTM